MLTEQYYLNRKELLLADFHSLLRKKSQLGWARFIVMVGIFIAGYFSFHIGLIKLLQFTNHLTGVQLFIMFVVSCLPIVL
jgi:hypothetical protein